MVRNEVGAALVAALMLCGVLAVWASVSAQPPGAGPAPPARRLAPPGAAPEAPAPEEGRLYVWATPDRGLQSFLVLSVDDDGTAEAAYLVPARVRLAPRAAGKPAPGRADLEKLLVGRLLTADLKERGKDGVPVADFWLGKEAGGWLSRAAFPARPPAK